MDSVSDICKYHLLCFVTIIEVKVISGHQVKKVKQKMFYVISQPFLKVLTWNLYTYSSAIDLQHIVRFFENFDFEGENFEKEKNVEIFEIFRNFQNFENPR